MPKPPTWLLDYAANTYSQSGEDGIIAKILDLLPARDRWCVEFGAWDGQYLSTTCSLIESSKYSAVLIEADKSKYEILRRRHNRADIIALNQFVGFGKADGLDAILRGTPIPQDFDFLSIDIDGNDYHVWSAIEDYSPKVICIEYNPTIPNEVKFVQPPDPTITWGCSLSALVELGKSKGYELVAALQFSAFFVKQEYFGLFQIADNRPDVLRRNLDAVTYIFSGYDGKVMLSGSRKLPWHDVDLRDSDVQALPRSLRQFPAGYSMYKRIAFSAWRRLRTLSGALHRKFKWVRKPNGSA